MDHEITREVTLPHPPSAVWEALTEGRRLSTWFGATVEIDPSPGGRVTCRRVDGSVRNAVVDAVEVERLLVLRWLPFEQDRDGNLRQLPGGRIRFVLDEAGGGTRLRVSETRDPSERPDGWGVRRRASLLAAPK